MGTHFRGDRFGRKDLSAEWIHSLEEFMEFKQKRLALLPAV
jgi:hypothetical protein